MTHAPKHCHQCGKKLSFREEEGLKRHYCTACRLFIYRNPLPVVAIVCVNDKGEILMIKRAQNPEKGKWALPSGFIEFQENSEKAALRELLEETGIKGKVVRLLSVSSRKCKFYKSLLNVGYLVKVTGGRLRKTKETLALGFFPPDKLKPIPFKSHRGALKTYLRSI